MSKVIELKIKTIVREVEHVKAIKCDVCSKECTGRYWVLNTYHNDWGNDSIDSHEYYDLCSKECINTKLDEYIQECKHSITYHFELEQQYFDEGE